MNSPTTCGGSHVCLKDCCPRCMKVVLRAAAMHVAFVALLQQGTVHNGIYGAPRGINMHTLQSLVGTVMHWHSSPWDQQLQAVCG